MDDTVQERETRRKNKYQMRTVYKHLPRAAGSQDAALPPTGGIFGVVNTYLLWRLSLRSCPGVVGVVRSSRFDRALCFLRCEVLAYLADDLKGEHSCWDLISR